MSKVDTTASLLALATVLMAAQTAAAQTTSPATPVDPQASSAPAGDTGDIVVTAQRRSENLQTVPVAITVVSGDSLRAQNINSTETLDRVVPSLTFKRGTANVNSTIAIRGLGTQSFASGAEPSVSTIIDGVVYGRSGMATQEFADLDRIEVLRGPQGTLFGKNASAGALNIVTRAPTKALQAEASAAYYDRAEYRASATVSGPLSDTVGALLSGYYGNYDGNARNVFNNTWVNGYEKFGIKGKLRGEFGDLTVGIAADYSHEKDDCCGDILGTFVNPTGQFSNIFLPRQAPVVPRYGNRRLNNNFTPGTTDTNTGVSATLDYKLGDYTLTSITAYRNWKNRQLRDGDFGSQSGQYVAVATAAVPATATTPAIAAVPGATQNIDQRDDGRLNFKQYSQEIRIASPSGRRFEYVAGAFFWWTDEDDTFTRSDGFCSASTLPVDATGYRPCSTTPGVSSFVSSNGPAAWNTKFRSQAGFAQATWEVVDHLKLIGGLRYTHDTVSYTFARTVSVADATLRPGIQGAFTSAQSTSANGWSGKTGLQYQATPDLMAYGTYSRGYKGPALNVFYSMTANNTAPISPETSNAFELGIKSKFFDRRLTLNAALYSQLLENFQANSFITQGGQTFVTLTNAGRVRSRGFEADFSARPTDHFTLTGGYTYNEGTIRAFACGAPGLTPTQLATCLAHNGKPLPFAPKHKFNLGADWRLPFTDTLPFDVRLGSQLSYSSRINFDLDQTPLAQQAPYALLDANITFASKDGKVELSLIGKNLTDKYYVSFVTPAGDGVSSNSYQRLQVPRDAERYFGVRGTVKY
ncbi:TonB-dependent receptor [Sphingomonas sp. PAMC 26605]|uniref:TonB-dependent receptor n=1 Tax=Sphingomonas sp. PAMC 26605 TaxID=1112214 RepID=UPI00026CD5D2|nr:TonB-dependent receptor [Sphingomonas sp. PAMC 26605]